MDDPTAPSPSVPATEPRSPRRRPAGAGLLLLVALVFASGVVAGRLTAPGPEAPGAASPAASAGTAAGRSPGPGASSTSSPAPHLGLPASGTRLGSPDARLVIDYWADYQCPFCARFAEQVIPALVSRIEEGSLALVHRDDAFLGPESIDAAVAVRCAGRQDAYWPMHDAVYAAQDGENRGAFRPERLARIAASVGLEPTAFAGCMEDRSVLVEVLDDTSAAVRAGVVSTPTLDVNGRRFEGLPDIDRLLATIDDALAGASPVPLPTREPPFDPWAAVPTGDRSAGPPDAPLTVELWTDYQAPGMSAVAAELEPELLKRAEAGELRVELRDLAALGAESVAAAAAVRCTAGQDGQALLVHDILASVGRGEGRGIFVPRNLLRLAANLGLDVRAFDACLEDPRVAAAIEAETAEGRRLGLPGGPAVVLRSRGAEVDRFTGELEVAGVLAAVDRMR